MLSYPAQVMGNPTRKASQLALSFVVPLTYASNGDANGLFYYLGTNYLSVWANPTNQVRIILPSGVIFNAGGDTPDKYFNRLGSTHVDLSGATPPLSFIIDLGVGRVFSLNTFSFRWRPDTGTYSPTGWTLAGSNDGVNFVTALTVTGQSPVASSWATFSNAALVGPYRYWRFLQTSSDQTGFLCTGQIEMYGFLYYDFG